MIWVRDRGGLLDPQALQLSQEEIDSGAFDPRLDEYNRPNTRDLMLESPVDSTWFTAPESEWNDAFDPDSKDERALSLFQDDAF